MSDQNKLYILELFKIVSTDSILVINSKGILKRLYCPFRVVAIVDSPPHIIVGAFYMVEAVKMTLELKEVFIISGKGYFIWYFKIT
jgi:hypothetical protein